MHLKVGYFVLYTPIYGITARQKRFHLQNCGMIGEKMCFFFFIYPCKFRYDVGTGLRIMSRG